MAEGDVAAIIEQADKLFDDAEAQKLYDLMIQHKDSKNDELLWRLARACREVSQLESTPAEKKKQLILEAHDYANQAVEINPNNGFCHKWVGITLSGVGGYLGHKKELEDANKVREAFEKAIELSGQKDGTSMHLLGEWCYTIADSGWATRSLRRSILTSGGSPPESTFAEALKHFEDCEFKSGQTPFCRNHLWMGMTYNKMNNNEKAKEWLTKCFNDMVTKDEERKCQEEAQSILARI